MLYQDDGHMVNIDAHKWCVNHMMCVSGKTILEIT